MAVTQPILDDAAALPPAPYPGLRSYESSEWAIYFGREPMIDEVITRLLDRHLVVVHGTSGCGKSSLIRAGVMPLIHLRHARGNSDWVTATMRPAGTPLRNLAIALADSLGLLPSSVQLAADEWQDQLALGQARAAVEGRLSGNQSQRLCLLVDQFEELFRFAHEGGRQEAQLFVDWICDLAKRPIPQLYILLTMRSDYIGQCAQFDGFAEEVDRCQYLLPRMDNLALLRAIHEPARLFGGKIDANVADGLLFAARREEDSLPILQHTLMRAHGHARQRHGKPSGWTVTLDDLAAAEGSSPAAAEGSSGALSTHAEEVLGNLTRGKPELVSTAEWVFRSLADFDNDGRIVRRPRAVKELVAVAGGKKAETKSVIEAFRARDCSFLMTSPPGELQPDTMVDVGHEALLRQWIRLTDPRVDPVTREPMGWLGREIEDGQRWRFLAVQAQAFMNDPSATLRPAITAAYERWLPAHNRDWAARHARQRKDPAREYDEVMALWEASKRDARKDRYSQAALCSLPGLLITAALLAPGFFLGIAPLVDGGFGAAGALIFLAMAYYSSAIVDRAGVWRVIAGVCVGALGGVVAGAVARGAFQADPGGQAYAAGWVGGTLGVFTANILGEMRKSKASLKIGGISIEFTGDLTAVNKAIRVVRR